MVENKYVAIYAKSFSDNSYNAIINRLDKAKQVYDRLLASYADEDIKVLIFGADNIIKNKADKMFNNPSYYDCKNIADMCNKIFNIIRDNRFQSRVYFVLSSWQWHYIEPLLRFKHEHYKFFYEGAFDPRDVKDINHDKAYEKVAKVKVKVNPFANMLDLVGSSISTDMKC